MIALTLAEIAEITGGTVDGDPATVVTGAAAVDSRQVAEGGLFVALRGERADGHDFVETAMGAGAAAVLASRPVPAPAVIVDDVTAALGLLAAAVLRSLRATGAISVVAITGSQGKTSVKDMLAHVLGAVGPTVAPVGSFNNELGVPLTVLRATESTRFLVVEMGARGIGHIATLCAIAPPDVSVVLNVGSAHVGEFGSTEVTARAKGELVEALGAGGVAVLNADDPLVAAMADRTSAPVLTFGTGGDLALGHVVLTPSGEPEFTLTHEGRTRAARVPQLGAHQAVNGAAAVAAAVAAGVDFAVAVTELATASAASPMRMQRFRRDDGLVVVNDAYNANPESMAAALRALASLAPRTGVAVLGPMLELGESSDSEHREIGRLARELGISRIVAVGADAIAEGFGPGAESVPDIDVALSTLSASLRPDHVVLVKASRGARLERVVDGLLQQ